MELVDDILDPGINRIQLIGQHALSPRNVDLLILG